MQPVSRTTVTVSALPCGTSGPPWLEPMARMCLLLHVLVEWGAVLFR
jgi:hypothetical protein